MKKEQVMLIQGALAAAGAFLSNRLGILFPLLCILMIAMVIDFISGMMASRVEAIDHPDDPNYGWNSKKGAKGIFKKVAYLCVIAVAMVVDYIIIKTAGALGYAAPSKVFFGLLVIVWYLLNELLSITENAGRMGAPVPEWLRKYIAILKNKIDSTDYNSAE